MSFPFGSGFAGKSAFKNDSKQDGSQALGKPNTGFTFANQTNDNPFAKPTAVTASTTAPLTSTPKVSTDVPVDAAVPKADGAPESTEPVKVPMFRFIPPSTGPAENPFSFNKTDMKEIAKKPMSNTELYRMTEAMYRASKREAERQAKAQENNIERLLKLMKTLETTENPGLKVDTCCVGTQTSNGVLTLQTLEAMLDKMKDSDEIEHILNKEWPVGMVFKTKTSSKNIVEPGQHKIILADRENFKDAEILEEMCSEDPSFRKFVEPMEAGDEIFRSSRVTSGKSRQQSVQDQRSESKRWSLGLALIDSSMDLQTCYEAFKNLTDGLIGRGVTRVTAFISHDFSLDIMMKICECCSYGNDLEIELCARNRGHQGGSRGADVKGAPASTPCETDSTASGGTGLKAFGETDPEVKPVDGKAKNEEVAKEREELNDFCSKIQVKEVSTTNAGYSRI